MGFSDEDQILMKNLYIFKGCGAKEHIMEFPNKGSGLRGLNKLLKKNWHDGYR